MLAAISWIVSVSAILCLHVRQNKNGVPNFHSVETSPTGFGGRYPFTRSITTKRDAANAGRLTILPNACIGSPRNMHEYAQDVMTYVRHYGRPDLFITFTCNLKWKYIFQMLLSGQTSSDWHDITCGIVKYSAIAKALVASKIIIWCECTTAHKLALEQILKDLYNDSRIVGYAVVLLSSDFRQTLPVIPTEGLLGSHHMSTSKPSTYK